MTRNRTQMPAPAVGPYELLEKIGAGGMCEVYRGRHRATGEVVAVKLLSGDAAANEIVRRRFEQEFRVASRLEHPNIVRALDFCACRALVLEFVEGESLGEKVSREGQLGESEAVRLVLQICAALEYAHSQGVIHRDVKPDNLMVTASGEVKVTDFGLVKEKFSEQTLTRTGRALGTPHYMAPEQFHDARQVDARADVYSLGATLYTLVTGTVPFAGRSPLEAWVRKKETRLVPPRSLVPGLSVSTERVILRSLDPDPARRPTSCAEMARELMGQGPKNPPGPKSASGSNSQGSGLSMQDLLTWGLLTVLAVGSALLASQFLFR